MNLLQKSALQLRQESMAKHFQKFQMSQNLNNLKNNLLYGHKNNSLNCGLMLGNMNTGAYRGGGTIGGWKELGRTTLGSASNDWGVTGLSDKRYYMILYNEVGHNTANGNGNIRLNSDSGTNYASRRSGNGVTDTTTTSETFGRFMTDTGVGIPQFMVGYFANYTTKEKLYIGHEVHQNTAGAGTAPNRFESGFKWANVTDAINAIKIFDNGLNNSAVGSELVVLGFDESDTHTDNFWEELASANGDGTLGFDSGSFTAKKYLWVQIYFVPATGTQIPRIRFNGDTGTSYADRYSIDNGADGTDLSQAGYFPSSGTTTPHFINMFIINNSANEKLIISHTVQQKTAGATTAPSRAESVGKWINTANQITSIGVDDFSGGNLTTGSIIKVWGHD